MPSFESIHLPEISTEQIIQKSTLACQIAEAIIEIEGTFKHYIANTSLTLYGNERVTLLGVRKKNKNQKYF